MEITALTKIGALLETHPELEEVLIERVPAFARLRNPVLRATVAKVATLEQVAKMGSVPLPQLLAFLNRALGRSGDAGADIPRDPVPRSWPSWYRAEAVVAELDALALLAAGNHPLAAVRQALAGHPPGAIVIVKSDFEPAPLLAQMEKEGVLAACVKEGPLYRTCLRRP